MLPDPERLRQVDVQADGAVWVVLGQLVESLSTEKKL